MSRPFLGRGGARNSPQSLRGRGRGATTTVQHNATLDSHVTTVGVKRPGFGMAGKPMQVTANFFKTTIPEDIIHQYDGLFFSYMRIFDATNLIFQLTFTAPTVFSPPAAYDGRKNMFSIKKFDFGENDTKEFTVIYPRADQFPSESKTPKTYKIKLTKVAEINPEVLQRFIEGKQSYDSAATTAITAMNVVVRMQPSMQYTYNVRSFFIEDDQSRDARIGDLRNGLRLWQGYFQSVRPAGNRMMINIDIATGVVFEGGPLIDLCLKHLRANPRDFSTLIPKPAGRLQDRDRLKLQRFTHGLRITVASTTGRSSARVVRKFSSRGADQELLPDKTKTVAQYYSELLGRPLQHRQMICVQVGNGALVPLELCTVIPGQLARQQVPPECARDMVRFASKRPNERLEKIISAPRKLGYTTSPYVRQFGLSTNPEGPISIRARVLDAPSLTAKEADRNGTVVPSKGAWNMDKKKFHTPVSRIAPIAFFSLESEQRFTPSDVTASFVVLRHVLSDLGIFIPAEEPIKRLGNPQGNIIEQLSALVEVAKQRKGAPPKLIVVILPELGNDLYTAVKHFGDVHVRQVLIPSHVRPFFTFRADGNHYPVYESFEVPNRKPRINVKLGGVNMALTSGGAGTVTDPLNPMIIMGADAIHPAPGATGRPSYTALVGNIDSDMAKFVAGAHSPKANTEFDSRVEIIHDLKEMAVRILKKWQANRKESDRTREARLLFYRELAALKEALHEVQITAKITLVVVAKRHHVRFFPKPTERDTINGNCPPGTVVDQDVCHPIEFDFYLQSHAGILGTSRPAHYSVLYDENSFGADTLQKFTYHLCYTYARATRAVSIPAPVYYADIVCSRAKNHYDPYETIPEADPGLADKADQDLENHKAAFRPLHQAVENLMYFSVESFCHFLVVGLADFEVQFLSFSRYLHMLSTYNLDVPKMSPPTTTLLNVIYFSLFGVALVPVKPPDTSIEIRSIT
ncbi:hypothetical protein NP233_g4554 [Leucocoprinus birnbaumii]|uniref:Argonaute-like protein n=1 Tax=Leucocoprinus birnbaumii TaxID=56174 RepID=A0AAD5VUI0_9AGAR|nr:hypothetical protein NP233_g4554 [Leucocoprinus birnbaumii]